MEGNMKKVVASVLGFSLALLFTPIAPAQSSDIPRLEKKDGRFALIVDGKPFLVLGGQINNSSAWPATLPGAWSAAEAMHANTVEAPVYWEQMEPAKGTFDFSNVDLLVTQARQHKLHLVLLWFGTWKNGQNHYVPEWIKSDPKTYPREENAYGKLLDVMSPNSTANLEADKTAFAALLRHVKSIDAAQHTVIMIQVENESGSVGSIRDFSPAAQKLFDSPVPADFARALHLPAGGNWTKTFGPDADESFAAYSTAHYIGEVAAAGKAEYPLPMYCNVWFAYPVHALENRDRPSAGQEYPSGVRSRPISPSGRSPRPPSTSWHPTSTPTTSASSAASSPPTVAPTTRSSFPRVSSAPTSAATSSMRWVTAPSASRPSASTTSRRRSRPNPQGAIASAPVRPVNPVENYALFNPPGSEIARLNLDGKLLTAVEDKGASRQSIHFADADAVASFGFPQPDGTYPPGTPTLQGRAVVAQLGPLEFLVSGFDVSVSFTLPASVLQQTPNLQLEILRAEEGKYVDGVWQTTRILNGDQTDRGLNFRGGNPTLVRIRLHTLPLYDEALHRNTE